VSVVAAFTVAGGASALAPDRTIVTSLPVRNFALTGRSVAFVADAPKRLQCAQIGLWNSVTNRRVVFESKEQCLEEGSTGQGVWDVAVSTRRLLWLTFAGGNFREWSLWTATTTRKSPRRLRFIARDVDTPPPIVIGPATADAVPYAVDRQVTYLGDDGRAIFRWTAPVPIRAVAAGAGPRNWRLAALQDNGTVVVLNGAGTPVYDPSFERKHVRSVRLAPVGLIVQMKQNAIISKPSLDHVVVPLPAGALMVDVAQARILWTRAGDLGATTIATGKSVRLIDGTPDTPALGQIEPQGIAWSVGRTMRWRAGALP
jgi:hypothetical protein